MPIHQRSQLSDESVHVRSDNTASFPMSLCGFKPLFLLVSLFSLLALAFLGLYGNGLSVTTPFEVLTAIHFSQDAEEEVSAKILGSRAAVFGNPSAKQNESHRVVLTIFTTFKNAPDRFQIHSNVLHNWIQFLPEIQPVLFTIDTDKRLVKLAESLGWIVNPVPRTNYNRIPFLKDMYFLAQEMIESVFYGYSNGDILFDAGLVDTLNVVDSFLDQLDRTMVVGRRTNVKMTNRKIFHAKDVAQLAKKGRLFRTDAEDYFFIAHNSFPWEQIPEIVIGRPAYDNFMVGIAIRHEVSVVDASRTLLALHQTGIDGDYAGHSSKDPNYNRRAIGNFNYGEGHTSLAQYFTRYRGKYIELWARTRHSKPMHALVAEVLTTVIPVTPAVNASRASVATDQFNTVRHPVNRSHTSPTLPVTHHLRHRKQRSTLSSSNVDEVTTVPSFVGFMQNVSLNASRSDHNALVTKHNTTAVEHSNGSREQYPTLSGEEDYDDESEEEENASQEITMEMISTSADREHSNKSPASPPHGNKDAKYGDASLRSTTVASAILVTDALLSSSSLSPT